MTSYLGLTAAAAVAFGATGVATADLVTTVGGETSVYLDFELLSAAAGLNLSGVSAGVIIPGELDDSVAFSITSPNSADLPTTFGYDSDDFFGTFGGTIEHRGAVYFNDDTIEVGNFTIGYRESGFYVGDNLGLGIILFDVGLTGADPGVDQFLADGDLLVSNEFATLLLDAGLAGSDLTGADVGDARIRGLNQVVPTPGALALIGLGGLAIRRRRA